MRRKGPKVHALLHSADLVEEQLRTQLAPLGIRPRQARILNALDRMESSSQIALAREFNVTPASMSTMTARLISAGLILRKTDPDKPQVNILFLSETGSALLSDVRAVWRNVDSLIEDAIGQDDADTLAGLATNLRIALGGHVPGARTKKDPLPLDMESEKQTSHFREPAVSKTRPLSD